MCFILTNCYGIIEHMRILLCNLIFLAFISSCSKQIQEINVSCQTDSFHDESLTFNFETNKVYISTTLNKYGHETKKTLEDRISPESMGEERYQEMMKVFGETKRTDFIRSITDSLIVFGRTEEPDSLFDIQSTFNRATLKMKTVVKYDESIIPEDSDMAKETVEYADCIKPVI